MRVIVVNETGSPDRLELQHTDTPVPGPGDLLVAVAAAGVNFIDTYHRRGLYPVDLPFTPGLEGAGLVVGVGEGVNEFREGDRVAWANVLGSYAEQHLVPQGSAVPIPNGVTEALAAAVMLQGLTARYLATSTYPVSVDDVCLVHAGAGGVGLLLTQYVKNSGARAITTVGSEEKIQVSRDAGADFVVNYAEEDFVSAITDRFGERPVSVVFDGVGKATFDRGLEVLKPRGMMVTYGNASGPPEPISPLELMRQGSLFLTRPTLMDHIATAGDLRTGAGDLLGRVARGELDVRIGAEYPLAEAADAHRALESRETTGKVLLVP